MGAASAHADRLINVPTGTKIHRKTLRFDALANQKSLGDSQTFVGYGLEAFDLEVFTQNAPKRRPMLSGNASYNFMVPIPDVAPGISIGLRDIGDVTHDGMGLFVAATYKFGQYGDLNQNSTADITVGAGGGAFRGAFLAASLPVTDQFRLLAEHDSRRITAGFEFRPVQGVWLRWAFQQNRTMIGLGSSVRF